MAYRKGLSLSTKTSQALAQRLREVREELYPEEGARQVAHQLGIPEKTWRHYESGVTVPAHFVLGFIELTGVSALWLLHGAGRKFEVSLYEQGDSRN